MRSSSSAEKSIKTEPPKYKSPELRSQINEYMAFISNIIKETSFRNREDKKRKNNQDDSKWKWLNDFL